MFLRVLSTEILKLKRTLALAMVVIAPMVVVLLQFLIGFFGSEQLARGSHDVWKSITSNSVGIWTILMMPLFLTLETSLLAGLEHVDKNWKNLLALPAPRWTHYLSKLVVTIGLLWAACVVLVGGTLLSGAILQATRPILKIAALQLSPLVSPMLRVAVAALCATAIQHWVSLRWQSFTAAMGFGMCAMVTGFIAVNSNTWGPRYPWSMPMYTIRSAAGGAPGNDPSLAMAVALAGAIVVAIAGGIEFSRREIN